MTTENGELTEKIRNLEKKVEILESREERKGRGWIKNKGVYMVTLVVFFLLIGVTMGTYLRSLENNNLAEKDESKAIVISTLLATTTTVRSTATTIVSSGAKANVFLKIAGMTCGGCVYRIERTLDGMDGISDVEIDLSTASGTVEYNPERIDKETIAKAITNSGYPATIISSGEEIEKVKSAPVVRSSGGSCGGGGGGGCGCGG